MSELTSEEIKARIDKRNHRLRQRQINDMYKVLGTPEGRRLIFRILSESGMFQMGYIGDNGAFYSQGRRDVGMIVFNDMDNARPEAFAQMRAEYKSDELQRQAEIDNDNKEKSKG